MKGRLPAACLLAALLFSACGPSTPVDSSFPEKSGATQLRLVSYHVKDWLLLDRDQDFQADDPKPLAEQETITRLLLESDADLLLLRGFGSLTGVQGLAKGLHYAHVYGSSEATKAAIISRVRLSSVQDGTAMTYRIKGAEFSLQGKFQHLRLEGEDREWDIIHLHFKDKAYHPASQNEMRRNEARLVRQYIVRLLKEHPGRKLLILGTLHDDPQTQTVRELRSSATPELIDARPVDDQNSSWTVHVEESDQYLRSDYLLHNLEPEQIETGLTPANRIGKHSPYRAMVIDVLTF